MRRRTGWRTCWPARVRARVQCVALLLSAVGARRSWRFWRCSRPGRRMCRSTRRCRRRGSEFMLADAAPIAAVTTAGLAGRLDGCDLPVIDVDDPRIDTQPSTALAGAGARGHRLPDLHLGHHRCAQGGGHHPPQRDPAAGRRWMPAWSWRGRCGRSGIRWPSTSRCGRSGVRCCMVGGWWWCPSRWRARRKTSTPCWSLSRSAC